MFSVLNYEVWGLLAFLLVCNTRDWNQPAQKRNKFFFLNPSNLRVPGSTSLLRTNYSPALFVADVITQYLSNTSIPHSFALCLTAIHRCCIFYKLQTLHKEKIIALLQYLLYWDIYCIVILTVLWLEPNLQYLQGMPILLHFPSTS